MRNILIAILFYCVFFTIGFAAEADVFYPKNNTETEKHTLAIQHFRSSRDNYYSLQTPEMIRAQIARHQEEKRTRRLIIIFIISASFLFLIGIIMTSKKLLVKYRVLPQMRLLVKKRHSSHTLDDVFEIEKKE